MSFSWEKYSSNSGDKGISIEIEWQGEMLPFRIKRVLTIDERQRANQAGVVIGIGKDGQPRIEKQDQAAFTKQIVLAGLKYWPFEYGEGRPVPITMKNIEALDGGLLDAIAQRILGIVQVNKEDYDPFESQSDAPSSQAVQVGLS